MNIIILELYIFVIHRSIIHNLTYMYRFLHTNINIRIHACTPVLTYIVHAVIHMHVHTRTYTYTLTRTHMCTQYAYLHIDTHAYVFEYVHMYAHICKYTRTYAHLSVWITVIF